MKKKNMFQAMIVVLTVGILIVFSLQDALASCFAPSGSSRSKSQPPPKERALKDIENEIIEARASIIDIEKSQIEWQQKAMSIYEMEKAPPPEEQRFSPLPWNKKAEGRYAYQNAKECEKAIEAWKQRLTRLEQERQTLSRTRGCFLPDTLVTMADGSLKPFERIQPGEKVLTYDIGYQTMVSKPVIDVYTVEGNHLYTINGEFSTTGSERLLSSTGWKRVRDLQEGDEVHIDGHMAKIVSIDYQRADQKLYNMQVDDSHNFYVVTDNGSRYLVHNSSGGGGSK